MCQMESSGFPQFYHNPQTYRGRVWVLALSTVTLLCVQDTHCGQTPTSRLSDPDPQGIFSHANSVPPEDPFRSSGRPFTAGLGSPYTVTDYLLGWPLPSSPHLRLYRCSVSRNPTQHQETCYRTKALWTTEPSQGESWQCTGSNGPYWGPLLQGMGWPEMSG